MKSQCSFFHARHSQDRVQTPWCFTPKVFQELSCAPSGSFLNNSPCEEESLGPGKPNNQQLIPRLGTHGPAFNQAAASAHDSLLLHLLAFRENFSTSVKPWPNVLYSDNCIRTICSYVISCLWRMATAFILVPPFRFHLLLFTLAFFLLFGSTKSQSLSSGSFLHLKIPSLSPYLLFTRLASFGSQLNVYRAVATVPDLKWSLLTTVLPFILVSSCFILPKAFVTIRNDNILFISMFICSSSQLFHSSLEHTSLPGMQ